jgi:acetolactate synthase-1/2/3 large subunit
MSKPLLGAHLLAKSIKQGGITQIFSLSGNHIMPVYDALIDEDLPLLHTRHEAAAVHMADAWARLKGEVGVALVTGGPGHANAVSALYTAYMSESPVVLLSGHAPLSQAGWGAFQEMDQVAMARPVVKAAWAATSADTLAADFARACQIARSGRPGPVHLSLPTDVLESVATDTSLPDAHAYTARALELSRPGAHALLERLAAAAQPMILVGPEGLTDAGRDAVAQLQQTLQIPVIASESPRGCNDPSLGSFAPLLAQADCVLLLGKRLDFTLGFGKGAVFNAHCRFLQIDADLPEFERSRQAVGARLEMIAHADVRHSFHALRQAATSHAKPQGNAWLVQVTQAVAWRPPQWQQPHPGKGLHPAQLCSAVQAVLDSHPDAVLVVDGGEFGQWSQACLNAPHRVINGAAGAIGSALPMAVAAKLAYPNAPVVAMMGDGTFGFHCAEYDTAVRGNAPFLAVVGNDACWNAEYQIQLRTYGAARTFGCELLPSNYEKVAAAFGGYGEFADSLHALPGALQRALDSGVPACVNVALDGLPAPQIRQGS